MEVPLPKHSNIRMNLDCQPLLFPDNPQQSVSIFLNGKPIEKIPLRSNRHRYLVILPKKELLNSPNTVEFRYTYARAPQDVLPNSQDTRLLAVAWHSIDFVKIDQ